MTRQLTKLLCALVNLMRSFQLGNETVNENGN